MAALIAAAAPAGAQPAWAHQTPGFQSNGAITVKSLAGGTYGGMENPVGAAAKANQSAVTQPPTVIIQATGNSNLETIPMINGSSTMPVCPSGYSATFTKSGSSCPASIWNVAGSRFSLIYNGGSMIMFGTENYPSTSNGGGWYPGMPSAVCTGNWSAALCTK